MKKLLTFAIVFWAILSLLYVAAEPSDTLPVGAFILSKSIGLCSLLCCVAVGKHLDRKGLLLTDRDE